MNSLRRFVRIGFGPLEERVARLTAKSDVREPAIVRIVMSGRVARGLDRAMARAEHAFGESRTAVLTRTIGDYWAALGRPDRRRTIGMALVTAPVIHVALLGLQVGPAGWLWLIVPGIVCAVGLLLIGASGSGRIGTS